MKISDKSKMELLRPSTRCLPSLIDRAAGNPRGPSLHGGKRGHRTEESDRLDDRRTMKYMRSEAADKVIVEVRTESTSVR